MGKYHQNKNKKQAVDLSRLLLLLPILLTVGLMPFIVRLRIYDPQLNDFAWFYEGFGNAFGDVFLYYRQWWFTGISIYMFMIVLFRAAFNRRKLQYSLACIPLGVYALFAFLSASEAICFDSGETSSSFNILDNGPRINVSGVRSSCDMFVKKSSFNCSTFSISSAFCFSKTNLFFRIIRLR